MSCQQPLSVGADAWWDSTAKTITCTICPGDTEAFVAGASAQRTAERRREKERAKWDEASLLKKAVIVWQDKPSAARPWERGAMGERVVGERLETLQQEGLIYALHDIRMPGTSANVDHVAIAPSGIHIIDAKNYRNKQISVENRGGMIRTDMQLRVGGRNETRLVDKLAKQILMIDRQTRELNLPTTVTPVLCFIDALWGIVRKEYKLQSVLICPPPRLERALRRPGPLSAEQIQAAGAHLRQRVRPA